MKAKVQTQNASQQSFPGAWTGLLQRKCDCGSHTIAGGECKNCNEQKGMLQRKSQGRAGAEVPTIVHDVLRSPGRPLDASTRAFFEPRFARNFSRVPVSSAAQQISSSTLTIGEPSSVFEQEADRMADAVTRIESTEKKTSLRNKQNSFDLDKVRIHTGTQAAESARAVNARAYTVGNDIVFGEGQYDPASEAGRHLLGHELTHTLQQHGNAVSLQRSCVSSPCPPVLVPIDALFPRYEAAERCIQTLYAGSHPAKQGISLSYNNEWQFLSGGRAQEKLALACLRGEDTPGAGPNFTARGGMVAAAPDIWDFSSQTMYEITTQSGSAFRINKLGAQLTLANSICGTAECGGLLFDRGTWAPPTGCFALGGDLYFTARNVQGVIIYNMFKDGTKELALAALLAAMAAAMKTMGPKAGAATAGKAVGGKLIPAYAIASLTAMALLLASGRAEAKLGPGDEEPLVSLFKELEKKGTKVPPEIQAMLDANPDLKKKMNDALSKGGDPDKALAEINKQILDTIAANKDQFTPEELETLLAGTQEAGKALPKGNMTVQELKKLAQAAKAGKTGDGSGTGGTGVTQPVVPPQSADKAPDAGIAGKPKDVPKVDAGGGTDKTPPAITQETRDKLTKSPKPVLELYQGLLGKGPDSQKPNDDQLKRFFGMMPPGLTSEKVAELLKKRKPVAGETADQILDSLQAALSELDKSGAKPPEGDTPSEAGDKSVGTAPQPAQTPARPNATATIGPTVDGGGLKKAPEQLIKELAARAKDAKFKNVDNGTYVISWKLDPADKGKLKAGSTIAGELQGRLAKDGEQYVGRVEAEITKVDGKNLTIKFITATPMVSASGKVVFQADHFLGRVDNVTLLDPPKKKKK
jgi:hypothetical protein